MIRRIRVEIDAETHLPVRAESFIPGSTEPVASPELVELVRDDFDFSMF